MLRSKTNSTLASLLCWICRLQGRGNFESLRFNLQLYHIRTKMGAMVGKSC